MQQNTLLSFECPITHEIMEDPVLLVGDGQTYERSAIVQHLELDPRSPITRAYLDETNRILVPNRALKTIIEEYKNSPAFKKANSPKNDDDKNEGDENDVDPSSKGYNKLPPDRVEAIALSLSCLAIENLRKNNISDKKYSDRPKLMRNRLIAIEECLKKIIMSQIILIPENKIHLLFKDHDKIAEKLSWKIKERYYSEQNYFWQQKKSLPAESSRILKNTLLGFDDDYLVRRNITERVREAFVEHALLPASTPEVRKSEEGSSSDDTPLLTIKKNN